MSHFKFQVLELRNGEPKEWVNWWANRYSSTSDDTYDEDEYEDLIKKYRSLTADDFIRIGKWKDNAKSPNKWKENVAQVAYVIWMQAHAELPPCPEKDGVGAFLEDWSERAYTDTYLNGSQRHKRFGLSRASTLLHFVSGGQYPIYDSRVRTAFARLLCQREMSYDIPTYLEKVLPLFNELAKHCGCEAAEYRKLDKALFSYGAFDDSVIKIV